VLGNRGQFETWLQPTRSVCQCGTLNTELGNQGLLERLEAENAQLRGSVVDLALQIQALRDG
jgi:hypothetical protein